VHKIKLAYEVKHTIAAPLKEVFAFFSDMHNIYACTSDVVDFEVIDKHTSKWQLVTKQELGICFTPEYTMFYSYEPDTKISWRSINGNVQINAILSLSSNDENSTQVTVHEEVSFMLSVSAIMSKVIKPIANIEARNDMLNVLKLAGNKLVERSQQDSIT